MDQPSETRRAFAHSRQMPLYFLHVRNSLDWPDEKGCVLPDLAAARRGAIEGIRTIAVKDSKTGAVDPGHCVRIANARGHTLMTVPFRAAFEVQSSVLATLH